MECLDINILKRNIHSLMKEHSLTQQDLGKIIGIQQPRVAKCLNDNDSSCFTLEQVFLIANHFGITIDELIGYKQRSVSYTPDAICNILINLFSTGTIKTFEHEVDEKVWSPDAKFNSHIVSERNKYISFYFPNYKELSFYAYLKDTDGGFDSDGSCDMINTFSSNMKINTFLKRFIALYSKYQNNDFSEKDYHILVDAYLKMVHD